MGCVTVQTKMVIGGSGRLAGAAPEEAAAIVAAVERFLRDTASASPEVRGAHRAVGGWLKAARVEALRGDLGIPGRWRETVDGI
jgi:hypothetical protein